MEGRDRERGLREASTAGLLPPSPTHHAAVARALLPFRRALVLREQLAAALTQVDDLQEKGIGAGEEGETAAIGGSWRRWARGGGRLKARPAERLLVISDSCKSAGPLQRSAGPPQPREALDSQVAAAEHSSGTRLELGCSL